MIDALQGLFLQGVFYCNDVARYVFGRSLTLFVDGFLS